MGVVIRTLLPGGENVLNAAMRAGWTPADRWTVFGIDLDAVPVLVPRDNRLDIRFLRNTVTPVLVLAAAPGAPGRYTALP